MAVYSISDLEKLSGVKAHTIRIWEKRYGLLTPKRTKTNIRYYLEEDLKKLLNIALLNRNGFKISKIAKMPSEEMHAAILDVSDNNQDNIDILSDALTVAMLDMDELKFSTVLQRNIQDIGFKRTMTEVVFPFLNRLGVLWMTGSISPAQENYVATLIKQKMYVALEGIKTPQDKATFLIYLPEQERQELSLLFVHYLLREIGYKVVNLGSGIGLQDLKKAYEIVKPDYLLTMINESTAPLTIQEYVEEMSLHFRNSTVFLTGLQLARRRIKSKHNYHVFDSIDDLTGYLEVN
ncbi:MAG: MerR family transcriptional regulator [Saprospiraceae bacterium]|nr:MerR family transcriptional regulator [Saprospiraceae bacterium]